MRRLLLVLGVVCGLHAAPPLDAARSLPTARSVPSVTPPRGPVPGPRTGMLVMMAACEYSLPADAPDGQLPSIQPQNCRMAVEHALFAADLPGVKLQLTVGMIQDVARLLTAAAAGD